LIKAALTLFPVVAAVAYGLEYLYTFNFLSGFGVSPEEIGVSQLKLLTRAGVIAILVLALFSAAAGLVLVGALIRPAATAAGRCLVRLIGPWATRTWLRVVSPVRSFGRTLCRNLRPMYATVRRIRHDIGELLRPLARGLRRPFGAFWRSLHLIMSEASAAIPRRPSAPGRERESTTEWRTRREREQQRRAVACLALAFPPFYVSSVAIDVFRDRLSATLIELVVLWLIFAAVVFLLLRHRLRLDLGSDTETIFLYDCATRTTDRVPLQDVTLEYIAFGNAQRQKLGCHPHVPLASVRSS